jgi:hypothetical protein
MEIKKFGPNREVSVAVTVMRNEAAYGTGAEDLLDGNTIPRLCRAVGEGACSQVCQLSDQARIDSDVLCAENNISSALEQFGVAPENFMLVAATADNIYFGDSLGETKVFQSTEGYSQLPEANAFFYRPGIDKGPNGKPIDAMGMRMADCGSINIEFIDTQGNLVIGQSHFSRTNMRGPSAFEHELDGKQVSWAEYVLGTAINHYGANKGSIRIYLAAAVEGKDFIHHYDNKEKMDQHYPGWSELGFMHRDEVTGETLIDYREMIQWQLENAADSLEIYKPFITTSEAINTGDLSLGHASHHWASKGRIEQGRDLYITGVNLLEIARIAASNREVADAYFSTAQFEYAEQAIADAEILERVINGREPDLYRPSY